jgi:hypothetical protein
MLLTKPLCKTIETLRVGEEGITKMERAEKVLLCALRGKVIFGCI